MAGKAAGMTVFAVEDEFSEPLREALRLPRGWVRLHRGLYKMEHSSYVSNKKRSSWLYQTF